MNILVCRWDIFVYPDILDTLKNQGHLFDVLDFSAIKMSDDEIKIFSKQLECKITSKYDAVIRWRKSLDSHKLVICNSEP